MHIFVELLHQVVIAGGKFVLLFQGNGEPVGLVDAVEGLLGLHVEVVVGDLLTDVGYLVGCDDGSTHVDRLSHHHATCPHVAGVGAEGIYHALPQGVALLLDKAAFLVEQSANLLRLFRGKQSFAHQFGHHIVGVAGNAAQDIGSQIAEC